MDGCSAETMQTALYDELADWWPLLSAPEEYAQEASLYALILKRLCNPRQVLELGSGGGNNASHLKKHFQMSLVDRSAGMLQVSRALNPECRHFQGDMRSVRLERTFDAVFIHDAVGYMLSPEDLLQALETAFVHCRPGGAALIVPDYVRETFQPGTGTGGHDGPDRSLRYLEWRYDPDPADTICNTDFALLLRRGQDQVEAVLDRHVLGLFERSMWLDLCRQAGFQSKVRTLERDEDDPMGTETFLCQRP